MQEQRRLSDTLFDDIANKASRGNYGYLYALFKVLRSANVWFIASFLRFNIGHKLFSMTDWLFGFSYSTAFFFIATFNWESSVAESQGLIFSADWVFLHGKIFGVFMFIHATWSWQKIQFGKGDLRISIGDSVIYWFFLRWWMRLLKLIDHESEPKTYWKLNENRWMKYWEPFLLLCLAWKIGDMGYSTYSYFLFIAVASYNWATWNAFANSAMMAHTAKESKTLGRMSQPKRQRKPQNDYTIQD